MLCSPICELLGIEYPVFQGGMAWIADAKLAAAVSIPLLLDEWNRAGRLHPGQHLVMCAFGAGLTTGTAAIDWTK